MALNSSNNASRITGKNGRALVNEKVDERILRLLGLEDVFDIDYDTYASLLKEIMVSARMRNQTLPTEEVEMVTNEWKRIKGKKGRFKVKKITAESFKKGTAVGINLGRQKLLPGVGRLSVPRAVDKISGKNDMQEIAGLLAEIIKNLTQQNKDQKKANERSRKETEDAKRELVENKLESGFKKAVQVAEKIIAPVKSLLRRIIDFFTTIFIGRALYLLLEWFGNKDNQEKLRIIFRFLGDHWPKLLALYIRFGTSFGRFVGGLSKIVIAGTLRLAQVVAKLIGAKGVARFLGGKGGKFLGAGLTVAATVGSTMALSSGLENFAGIDNPEKEPKTPTFSGGGLANFKKLFGFFGGGPGYVSGQKGVDKIPAMLSDGEFVMSRGAVQKYGVSTLEAMNAAGGGTNRPRMIRTTAYAQGGGLIASKPTTHEIEREAESGLIKPGKMSLSAPSSGSDQSSFEQRLRRIEFQLQTQNSLALGRNQNPKSFTPTTNLTYKGRTSVNIPNLTAMQKWAKANPKLAIAAAERARIRGTAQSNNPLLNRLGLRGGMPVTPTVQAPGVLGLGAGNQSLTQNIYAGRSPVLNQTTNLLNANISNPSNTLPQQRPQGMSETDLKKMIGVNPVTDVQINYQNAMAQVSPTKPNLKPPGPPTQPRVVVQTISVKKNSNGVATPSTGGVPSTPTFSAAYPTAERSKKKKILNIF